MLNIDEIFNLYTDGFKDIFRKNALAQVVQPPVYYLKNITKFIRYYVQIRMVIQKSHSLDFFVNSIIGSLFQKS